MPSTPAPQASPVATPTPEAQRPQPQQTERPARPMSYEEAVARQREAQQGVDTQTTPPVVAHTDDAE